MQLNEAIKVDKYRKLKDSIHTIISNLSKDEWLTTDQLSKMIKKYNINISGSVIKKLLEDWVNNKSSIFNKDDYDWLYYDKDNDIVFSTIHFSGPPLLGKSRRKIIKKTKEEEKEKKEKLRISIIEDVEKFEKDNSIRSPIPVAVILDTFIDLSKDEVIRIQESIYNAIIKGELDFLYEPAWDFMIDLTTRSISEGGLGMELSKDWKKNEPDPKWVIPSEKDFDKGVPVWYFRYGKGKIENFTGIMLIIEFNLDTKITKRLRSEAILANRSIRIDKRYVKKPVNRKGYEIAYLKDIKEGDEVYHKKRRKNCKIKSISENDIRLSIDNKIIKLPVGEFLKEQNIIKKKQSRTDSYGQTNIFDQEKREMNIGKSTSDRFGDYELVNKVKELEVGDEIYFKGFGNGKIKEKEGGYLTIEISPNRTIMYQSKILVDSGKLYKKRKSRVDRFLDRTNDAYRRSNIGFNKDTDKWEKIKNKDELKVDMKVLYNGNIKRINKIENGRISIAGGGSTIEMPIWQILDEGVWKRKQEMKGPGNQWVRIKNEDEFKVNMEIMYKDFYSRYMTKKVHRIFKNGRILLSDGNVASEYSMKDLINDGVWKKIDSMVYNVNDILKNKPKNKWVDINGRKLLFRSPTHKDIRTGKRVYVPSRDDEGTINAISAKSIMIKLDNPKKFDDIIVDNITLDTERAIKNDYILVRDDEVSQNDIDNFLNAILVDEPYISKASSLASYFDKIDEEKLKKILNKAFVSNNGLDYELIYNTLLTLLDTFKRYKLGQKYIHFIKIILDYITS